MTTHAAPKPAPFYDDISQGPIGGATHWAKTTDGLQIRIGHWPLEKAKGTVFVFPGRTEFIEKYGHVASEFHNRGYASVVIDWRGQGLADRMTKTRNIGHVCQFSDYQLDVAAVLESIRTFDLPEPYFLLGHSMGGAIGLEALHRGLPVKAAVFTAPMWGIHMTPFDTLRAWTMSSVSRRIGGGHFLTPGTKIQTSVLAHSFETNQLTTDPAMYDTMRSQVLRHPDVALGGPSLQWLNEALKETLRLSRQASPDMACLTFLGTDEAIVDSKRVHQRMQKWPKGTLRILKGAKHELMEETADIRNTVYDETCGFFDKHL